MYLGRVIRNQYFMSKEELEYNQDFVDKCVEFTKELLPMILKQLELDTTPNIQIDKLPERVFGFYQNSSIVISVENIIKAKVKNRASLGFCIAEFLTHELTHYKQDLERRIPLFHQTYGEVSYLEYISNPLEIEANKSALKFSKKNEKEIYRLVDLLYK